MNPESLALVTHCAGAFQNVVCAGLEDAGFVAASIAAVGLFYVVEHIAEDFKFRERVASYLRSNGRVYLTVPVYQSLWSPEDVDAGHFRRYSRQALRDLLKGSWLAVARKIEREESLPESRVV